MSVYYCELCDRTLDGDWIVACEWGDKLVCESCHTEHTPEDWEDWKLNYWKKPIPDRNHDWELTHKDYDGPGDPRAFTGPSIEDVYQQAIEYNEEMAEKANQDPMDDGDWAYDNWKDKQLEKQE